MTCYGSKDNSFYQAITNEELQVRVDAVKNMSSFCEQLGPQRTLEELFPSLSDVGLLEDEDEVLSVLSEELGKFLPLVGGEAHLPPVLELLEVLLKNEEANVRDKAIASISTLGSQLSEEYFQKYFIDLVIRLSESEWYTPKISACVLFPEALKKAPETVKPKLVSLYLELCKGTTPMVRRAAASNLKNIIPFLSLDVIRSNFLEVFKTLAADEQDSVRFLAVEISAALAAAFRAGEETQSNIDLIKPVILACAQDKSWRVRYMVASCFVSVADGLGAEITQNLVYVFVNLLKDSEAEVRTAAASRISGVAKLLSVDEVIKSILPCVSELVSDQSQQVRKALASDVMMLAPVFGNVGTSQHLLCIFLRLLKDVVPEVRLNIISKLDQVTNMIGLDKLSEHLIPAIIELAEDKQWRTRLSVIKYIPPLARQLDVEFFSAKLGALCYGWLGDTVCAIRTAAVANLTELTQVFGEDFARTSVLPKITELKSRTNYLYRMTILLFVSKVSSILSDSLIKESLLPLTLSLAVDPVPNVRFLSASTLESLYNKLDKQTKETQIRPVLEKLCQDKDSDVCSYAAASLKNL